MKITREQLDEIKRKMNFNDEQLGVIEDGAFYGLTYEQINFYATTIFDAAQMNEIYLGFKNGLTMDEVKIFANSKRAPNKMKQIRLGLEHSLGDKVNHYKDFLSHNDMRSIRVLFERDLHPDYLNYIFSMSYLDERLDHKQLLIAGLGVLCKIQHNDISKMVKSKKYCNALYHSFSHATGSRHVDSESILENFKSSFNRYYKNLSQ